MSHKEIIREWFGSHGGAALLLPDGWFGRPYDNRHSLSSIEEQQELLTIVLDEKLKIIFDRLEDVVASDQELSLFGFNRCRFEWENWGGGGGAKEYRNGRIQLIANP